MEDAINLVRIQETQRSIELLQRSLDDWLDRRQKKDSLNQYKTLLSTLRLQVNALIKGVRTSFRDIRPTDSRGIVYAACRLQEKRLLWIERLWTYFREKFDQRDNPGYRDALAGADEVVWSCYAEPFRAAGNSQGPAPLPWIAAEYSPKAIPRKDVPQDLRSEVDAGFLQEMLRELPVPIVSLPPQCAREPWWLIYLAHEIGHHVQFDLLPNEQLVDDFRDLIKSSIVIEDAADIWQYRGEEVFADAFSLYMTGPWALWALTELEWTTETAMLDDSNVQYPSPATRLLLMNEILHRMNFAGDEPLRGLSVAAVNNQPEQVAIRTAIADAIAFKTVAGTHTLGSLCAWNPDDHQGLSPAVTEWKETFLRNGGRAPDETLRAARIALAGGVAAWAEICLDTDRKRRTDMKEELAPKLLKALRESHEPVERAAAAEPRVASTESRGLHSLLFDSSPTRLGAW